MQIIFIAHRAVVFVQEEKMNNINKIIIIVIQNIDNAGFKENISTNKCNIRNMYIIIIVGLDVNFNNNNNKFKINHTHTNKQDNDKKEKYNGIFFVQNEEYLK